MAINLKKPNLNDIFSVPGIQLAVTEAGIKYKDKKDLALILADEGSHAAAVFTKNKFIAAPVIIAKKNLKQSSRIRACIINTGSANAGTGKNGLINAQNTCDRLASQFHIKSDEVLPFSTGVIMKHLPMEKINQGISALALKLNKATWIEVAEAIMTTDTVPKVCSKKIMFDDEEVVITGIAKGSGMIHPNMATMLAFITTNASIEHNLLTQIVSEVTEETFNLISVDGDTSTNDSFVVISTNQTKKIIVDEQDADFKKLHNIVLEVARYLAHAIVRDGEGATKFIKIQVCNGQSKLDCKEIAKKIAHSPLIKTAFFASDPNLGRIMAAIGNAEVSNIDISKINIYLNDYLFAENGALATSYDEAIANKEMKKEEISLKIDLQNGNASQNFYTTDLSYDYVKINAEYRT